MVAVVTGLSACLAWASVPAAATAASPGAPVTYRGLSNRAAASLERLFTPQATWDLCDPDVCGNDNLDWGADSMTYDLYLRWFLEGDPTVVPIMRRLVSTAYAYKPSTYGWSDVPMWDTIADVREYEVTHDPLALKKAEHAFAFVATYQHSSFAAGACPSIDYQVPGGGSNGLKTLESDSNFVKAALLLFEVTHTASYLEAAKAKYLAIRRYFLSKEVPLYTVYVFDNGASCHQVRRLYFASVNGNMIFDGATLTTLTGKPRFRRQALATARAVARRLGDGAGVFADLQAENDVEEPMVEGMLALAQDGYGFATSWLLRAADASASDRAPSGLYGRFFDGPPGPVVTAWQTNGGLALQFVAGALDPGGAPSQLHFWDRAVHVALNRTLDGSPVTISFSGKAVAIMGTIGEHCCQTGHAEVLVDGKPTFDAVGIWQNKVTTNKRLPGSVLFAWRWPTAGHHVVEVAPAPFNAKQGGSYFHMVGYSYVR